MGQGTNYKAKNKQRLQKVAEPTALYQPKNVKEYQQQVKKLEQQMQTCSRFGFEKAASIRDQLHELKEKFISE